MTSALASSRRLVAAGSAPLLFMLLAVPAANADTLTIKLNTPLPESGPPHAMSGGNPWVEAIFSDVDANHVQLQIVSNLTDSNEFVGSLYLNYGGDTSALTMTSSGGVAASTVSLGNNSFRADGDGYFDIAMDFSGNFVGGQSSTYTIAGT